jgi:predicted  nucleic acid-binding Zn-ribbon protein
MPTCDELATKAELQELRDQLNAVLGEKEGGGTATIFEKGLSPGATGAVMLGTTYVATRNRAADAIIDVILTNPSEASIWQGLKSGAQKLETVAGNGVKKVSQSLTKVGDLVGKNVSATAMAAKGAGASAKASGLLADLTVLGGSLALNIATVNTLDKRIQAESEGATRAIDAANQGMLRLHQKQQGDISAVNSELEANRSAILQNQQNIANINAEIADLEVSNAAIRTRMDIIEADAQATKAEIQTVKQEIDAFEIEVTEITAELKADIAKTEASVNQAFESIAQQKVLIDKAFEEIEYIKIEIANLDQRIAKVEIEIDELKANFEDLRTDLDAEIELQDAISKLTEARLIILEKKIRLAAGGGGVPISVTEGLANAQASITELTDRANATESTLEGIASNDLVNNPEAFKTEIQQLLQGIETIGMTPAQLEALRTNLNTDFGNTLDTKLNAGAIPKLDAISLAVAPAAISSAVQTGVCNSLNSPGSCPGVPGNPNTINGLGGMNQRIQDVFNAGIASMQAQTLIQTQDILGVVQDTNRTVRHGTYGLETIQKFASTAWKVTQADKVMSAITVAMTIHNAMMLSNNLLATVSEATNMALNALGIRDETDKEIDIGVAVKSKIEAILTNLLGAEQYQALTTRIAKANRIYQASANLHNLVREVGDTTRSIAEVSCENTGKIGNALLRSGVVYEDAYQEMIDSVNPQSKAQLKLEKFRNGVEVLENASEAISSISSDVIELQDLRTEITEGKEQLDTAREEFKTAMETQKQEIKEESQAETDLKKEDFARDESETN